MDKSTGEIRRPITNTFNTITSDQKEHMGVANIEIKTS